MIRDEGKANYSYWAGKLIKNGTSDFKKKRSPVTDWESACFNGGIL